MPSQVSSILFLCSGIVLLAWNTEVVEGFPSGAPKFACRSGRPNHNEEVQPPQTFPVHVLFMPDRAMPGETVNVFVFVKNATDRFQGMLVTARPIQSPDTLVGGFTNTNSSFFRTLNCTSSKGHNSALTHRTKLSTDQAWFRWTVPRDASVGDMFLMRFTLVRRFVQYWVGVDSPFIVGAPTLRPIDFMNSDPSRPSGGEAGAGAGTGARMSTGQGSAGVSTQNGQTGQLASVPSGNGQPTGASSMSRQPIRVPSSSTGQQADRRPTGGLTQQLPRVSNPGRNRLPQTPPPRTPSSSSDRRAPPSQPASSSDVRTSAGRMSGSSTSGNRQSESSNPSRGSGSLSTQLGMGNNPTGFMPVPGTRNSRPASSGQEPDRQTNSVAGVQLPAARTNTLPEGQGREQRGWGTTNSGGNEEAAGGMSAWVSGWFG